MIKIVYFDEKSAIDYIDIYFGGRKNEDQLKQKNTSGRLSGGIGGSIQDGTLFKMLGPLLKISVKSRAEAQLNRVTEDLVRTTISNTVLSDYINLASTDDKIIKFDGYRVYPEKNSISHIKMYTPYLKVLNAEKMNNVTNLDNVDIAEIDSVLENAKGYYELIAEKEEQRVILRFNIKAFKNNYFLSDLIRMDLQYLAVKTGKMNFNDLIVENEFKYEINEGTSLAELEEADSTYQDSNSIEVYDVVLAGVTNDG